jgi:hypothetical protein
LIGFDGEKHFAFGEFISLISVLRAALRVYGFQDWSASPEAMLLLLPVALPLR